MKFETKRKLHTLVVDMIKRNNIHQPVQQHNNAAGLWYVNFVE